MGYPTELQDRIDHRGVIGHDTVSSGDSSAIGRVAAYRQSVGACVVKWSALLALLLSPLRQPDTHMVYSQAAGAIVPGTESVFASTHVLHLPVLLLAVAQAAVEQQAQGALQLVAAAAEAAGDIDHMDAVAVMMSALMQQTQEELQQQQQGRQQQQQQQDAEPQQQTEAEQRQEQDVQQRQEGNWQKSGVVLLLLRQLLKQAPAQQWHPHPQQQTVPEAAADTAAAAAAAAADAAVHLDATAAGLSAAIQQCVVSLASLLVGRAASLDGGKVVAGIIHGPGKCQRMAHVLQMIEAGVRCMAALEATTDTSISSSSSSGTRSAAGDTSPAPEPAAATAAGSAGRTAGTPSLILTTVQMCAKVLTVLQGSIQDAERRRSSRRVRQHQQALQLVVLVAEAALSLLLTVSKLPGVMQSAEVCATLATCIICLQQIAAAVGGASAVPLQASLPLQQPQQQQQQQEKQASGECPLPAAAAGTQGKALLSAPQYDLQRAVLVLTGRYLLLVGAQAKGLAAVQGDSAADWAAHVLLGLHPKAARAAAAENAAAAGNAAAAVGTSQGTLAGVSGAGPVWDLVDLTVQNGPPELTRPRRLHSSSSSSRSGDSAPPVASGSMQCTRLNMQPAALQPQLSAAGPEKSYPV
jgi:hypothetical protein